MGLLEKLLDKKASEDNTICLNAYASGILDSKAPEMLEMLKMLVRLAIAQGANDEWIEIKEAKKLINEATNV